MRVASSCFWRAAAFLADDEIDGLLACHRIRDAEPRHPEIVPDGGFQVELFQRRDFVVPRRKHRLDRRRFISDDLDRQLGFDEVGAAGVVHEFELQTPRMFRTKRRLVIGVLGVGRTRSNGAVSFSLATFSVNTALATRLLR